MNENDERDETIEFNWKRGDTTHFDPELVAMASGVTTQTPLWGHVSKILLPAGIFPGFQAPCLVHPSL